MAAPARREPHAAGGAVAWRPAGDRHGGAGPSGALPASAPARGGKGSGGCAGPSAGPAPCGPAAGFPRCYSPPRRYRRELGPGLRPQETPAPRGAAGRAQKWGRVCGLWDRSRTEYEFICLIFQNSLPSSSRSSRNSPQAQSFV